ncbi:hypothetical protein NUW54_g4012 [Trametes sanguinea]|uniref:Uncharacterized protein n=1 Tax=Trametes sanguinea TaxID=158606 RepID=A0ACC1Q1X8_9APHY|nr:hypothetical protein NUW54_g4012 [Trametes sanguinea]
MSTQHRHDSAAAMERHNCEQIATSAHGQELTFGFRVRADICHLEQELEQAQSEIRRLSQEIDTLNMLVETFRRLWHFYHDLSKSLEGLLVPFLDKRTARQLFPFRHDADV